MKSVTHLEKVITGEASAVTHLEQVVAQETAAVTYTEKVIAGTASPITHLQKVIAGEASPITHLECVWAGSSPSSEHEYTGAVPVTITADGTPLIDYLISGNTTQNGTPTSTLPIMPEGCGERTENLFDKSKRTDNSRVIYTTGKIGSLSGVFVSDFIPIEPNTTYTLNIVSSISGKTGHLYALYDVNKNFVNTGAHEATPATEYTFTTPSNVAYIRFNGNMASVDEIMLNSGSTALPYEPYGYKIPISSAGQTNNIYLGEVPTTRNIRKLVLTGEETSWTVLNPYYTVSADNVRSWSGCICTHCAYNGIIGGNSNTRLWIKQTSFPDYQTLEDFKTYLQQQYAAGTPVCVWYVLATEETAVVNEPLCKIDDYADTLSKAQALVSIPTNNGSTTVDVDTTVKPSEIYIKYMG